MNTGRTDRRETSVKRRRKSLSDWKKNYTKLNATEGESARITGVRVTVRCRGNGMRETATLRSNPIHGNRRNGGSRYRAKAAAKRQ